MVRTSTAEKHGFRCPLCGDDLRQDHKGRGFVKHVTNPYCSFERGERDNAGVPRVSARIGPEPPAAHQAADGMRVCGYSERGIFNALFYEIVFSSDPIGVLRGLLSLICFPEDSADFSGLRGAEVFVEQSLSDFGDADAILLLQGSDFRCVLFVEGKVKTSQKGQWTVLAEWRKFLARKGGKKRDKLDSSNVFTQLFHKVRFIAGLRDGGIASLQRGIAFPACSTRSVRKIGNNLVVLEAAKLIDRHAQPSFYVAVVPDSVEALEHFFANELRDGPGDDMVGWDTRCWGFLCWEQIESFCRKHCLVNTLRVFDFNRGQIY